MSEGPTWSRFPSVAPRDVLLVGRFELLESVRTRRVVVLALLFVVGGGLSGWGFAHFLAQAEQAAATALAAPGTARPGAMLQRFQRSYVYRDILKGAVDDPETAEALARVPPLALVFAWLAMTFAPLLVIFASSDTISSEIETRTLRYTLLRTGRFEYVAGKFGAQLLLLAGVVALSGAAFLGVCAATTSGLGMGETALAMGRLWPWIVINTLPYLALALVASMLARSAQGGRALAIGLSLLMALAHSVARAGWARRGPVLAALLDLVDWATPYTRGHGMLAPPGATFARALVVCTALPLAYLAIGLAIFRRRDL